MKNRTTICKISLCLAVVLTCVPQALVAQGAAADPYQAIIKRDFGTATDEVAAIEKQVQDAKAQDYPALESRFLAVLQNPESTLPGKQFACQMLRIVGSPKCIPIVGGLLTDEKLSHIARYVFLEFKDPAVDDLLRQSLAKSQGNVRIGLINTIGDRKNRASLSALTPLLMTKDAGTVQAALNAIGKIGSEEAVKILDEHPVADPLKAVWADAYLHCAANLNGTGDLALQEKMYRALYEGPYSPQIRAAAFSFITKIEKEHSVPRIMKELASQDAIMKRAAVAAVIQVPGNVTTAAFAGEAASAAPEIKIVLLKSLASRGDPVGLTEQVNKMAADPDPLLREAAIHSLVFLGNATSVSVLTSALKEPGPAAQAATQTLTVISGEGIVQAILQQAESADAATKPQLFAILTDRKQIEALPLLRKSLTDADIKIARAAFKGISKLGVSEDLVDLTAQLLAKKDPARQEDISRAMSAIGIRMPNKESRCDPVIEAFAKADADTKVLLLSVLSAMGGDKSLQIVRTSLNGTETERKAAVRALGEWSDTAPMSDILKVATEDKDDSNRILALRGYIRMIGLRNGKPEEKLQLYRQAGTLATRADEKRLVLAGLVEVPDTASLVLCQTYITDAELKDDAFNAYERIAESIVRKEPDAAREAFKLVMEAAPDAALRSKAEKALAKIKPKNT